MACCIGNAAVGGLVVDDVHLETKCEFNELKIFAIRITMLISRYDTYYDIYPIFDTYRDITPIFDTYRDLFLNVRYISQYYPDIGYISRSLP